MDGKGKVQVLEEKVVTIRSQKRPELLNPLPPLPPVQPIPKNQVQDIHIVTMALTLCKALGQRLAVFLSLSGAFILGLMAVKEPDTMRLIAAATYDLMIFIPILIYGVGK